MRTPLLILCCLLLLAGSGCRRKRQGMISGRILENCAGDPAAGEKVYFYTLRFGGGKGTKIAEAVTDASGYFSVSYEYRGRRSIMMYALGSTVRGIPSGTTDLGNIYKDHETKSVVKVIANNAYALSNDEFNVKFDYPESYSMHTPFHDTVFPAHVEHSTDLPGVWYGPHSETHAHTAYWSYTNGLLPPGETSTSVPFCNQAADTIYITIN